MFDFMIKDYIVIFFPVIWNCKYRIYKTVVKLIANTYVLAFLNWEFDPGSE